MLIEAALSCAGAVVVITGAFGGTVTTSILATTGDGALSVVGVEFGTVATVGAGGTQQFGAVGKDASGNVVAINATWALVAGGGTISGAGLFTAGAAAGTYTNTVQATSGAVTAVATVNVTAGALASISVSPNPANLGIGGTQQFTAIGKDASGNVVTIAPTWTVVPDFEYLTALPIRLSIT